nr:efflux RND transporter periplasmic adaptor subunit [Methylocystis bryophila]
MAPPAPGQSRAASGVIEAASPIRVAAKVSGLVRSVDCEAGAHVRQGQLCATIDAPALKQAMTQSESALRTTQARVAQDRAALAAAQARSARRPAAGARVDALRAALSRDERDAASAQQELDAAKARQDDAKIVAPTDGVVLARNIQAGQDVDADAKQLLFLFAPEEAIIAFRVSSPASLGALKPGERVSFTVEELRKQSFDGEVLRIESGHGGGQVVVRAKNPGAALKPGMKASLQTPAE